MSWAYFYFMKNEPARVREVAPHHAHYWSVTDSTIRGAAPFSDRSGGLIIFEAPDEKQPRKRWPTTRSSSPRSWSSGGSSNGNQRTSHAHPEPRATSARSAGSRARVAI